MPQCLWSGISSLDNLFDSGRGIRLDGEGGTVSICVIGPPGSGKTSIGLHYALHYSQAGDGVVDPREILHRTVYMSTDLPFGWARALWTELEDPRQHPASTKSVLTQYEISASSATTLRFSEYLMEQGDHSPNRVAFVDLKARPQDDWNFVNRLMAMLPLPEGGGLPHFMVIDALDGLENWDSDEDSFGFISSRRSKLVQLLRAAAGRSHLLFIAEEHSLHNSRPEESVCDVVLRLKPTGQSSVPYTIEITKARGQTYIRGPQRLHLFSDDKASESQQSRVADSKSSQSRTIFIGHGRSPDWRVLKDFISERLHLGWVEFNREPVAGISTTQRLDTMLQEAGFAFLIMSAEDEHSDGEKHARENVIHELGLFQGRLGFKRAIILLQEGCVEFSNINGLTHIRYPKDNIRAIFEDVRQILEREGLLT